MASSSRRGERRLYVAYRPANGSLQVHGFEDLEISHDSKNWQVQESAEQRANAFILSIPGGSVARKYGVKTAEQAIQKAEAEGL